ncbi:uncharacterized protein LOC126633994 [Malus sylvestris]|uniref:uncharacterized protein LOC126633994 n=1 Tax=Malus sylvestris TaxID=3752 RepID=UPI0021AD448E|nr:uncharacterized protein LOC126633994 [Malus sylvestris]
MESNALNEMRERNIKPDNVTCNTLINAYCKIGDTSCAVVTETGQLRPVHIHPARSEDVFVPHHHQDSEKRTQTAPLFRFIGTASSSSSYDLSSLRDRTKDIMSVVVSLLFGVGCGALTAATMYLAWSVFISRHDDSGSSSFDDDFKDLSPKKVGYVKIPEVTADSVSPPPSTV